MNESLKKILLKYVYFSLIIFAMFLLLSLSIVLSRKSWTLGLKDVIQITLNEVYPDESLSVDEAIQIEQPLSVSAACYRLSSAMQEDDNGRAVLVRITGIAGPSVSLFIRKPGESVFSYAGVVSDNQLYDESFPWYGVSHRQIDYWKDRIPLIIGEVE